MVARDTYRWGVILLAIALTATASMATSSFRTDTPILLASVWAGLIAAAALAPLTLRGRGPFLSFTPAIECAALLLFGPAPAVAIVVVGRGTAALIARRAVREAGLAVAEGVVTIGASILTVAIFASGDLPNVPPELATLLGYGVAHGILATMGNALATSESLLVALGTRLPWDLARVTVVLPLGAVLAHMPAGPGAVAAAYGLLPLVLLKRHAVRNAPATPHGLLATVRALMATIDAFDPFTRGHSARISSRSVRIARHLGLTEPECLDVELGALLHDIGRTAIHLDILQSPRALDANERAMLQTHPRVGYEIVKALPDLEAAAEVVHAHHEQPDGRGYPRGLMAERIPMGARIIMVVAAFDAMTRERPYRRGLSAEEAFAELRRHSGSQFFPDVVEALADLHAAGRLDDEPATTGMALDALGGSERAAA